MEVLPVSVAAWKLSDGGFKILAINVSREIQEFNLELARWQPQASPLLIEATSTPNGRARQLEPVSNIVSLSLKPHQAVVLSLKQ